MSELPSAYYKVSYVIAPTKDIWAMAYTDRREKKFDDIGEAKEFAESKTWKNMPLEGRPYIWKKEPYKVEEIRWNTVSIPIKELADDK